MEGEAETGMRWLGARHCQPCRNGGQGRKDLPRASMVAAAQDTPSRTCGLHDLERIHFCCFKPPSLWSSVMVTTGH